MTTTLEPATLLRLAALDAEDLAVISANMQDAAIPVAELAYLAREKRFVLVGRRFDWVRAAAGGCERCATGLHFDFVRSVSRTGFAQEDTTRVLNLLAIAFEPSAARDEAPGGTVTLTFSGGAAVRLDVECIEAQLRDLGPRWACGCEPRHALDDA